jgi:hypothetical protein
MEGKMWPIIKDMYEGYNSCVRTGGRLSKWFEVKQGVHQGSAFSMLLFVIFLNPMIKELKASRLGACIGDVQVPCPTSADDTAFVTLSHYAMQKQVYLALSYRRRWRFSFGPPKCLVMLFSANKHDNVNTSIKMGTATLKLTSSAKHLGKVLSTSEHNEMADHEECVSVARCMVYGFLSIGDKRTPINPKSVGRVYKSIAIPRMLYGTEVASIDSSIMRMMKAGH